MQIKNFKDMYVIELQELANMESQLDEALKRMADAATHPALKKELMRHREETRSRANACNRSCRTTAQNCERITIRPWKRS